MWTDTDTDMVFDNGILLVKGIDFQIQDGKIMFDQPLSDSTIVLYLAGKTPVYSFVTTPVTELVLPV
jgi:hypothetical protein